MNYIFQIEDQLKASGIEYPNEYFIALGKEIYQTNGWDIDNEIRYPENTKTNIKIVDIDALINKLQKDKNKKAE